jgi:hypothetical protein
MNQTPIKERPILFSAPMVRALFDGRKTQTRRVVKGLQVEQDAIEEFTPADPTGFWGFDRNNVPLHCIHCPYGEVGDRLWVRENFAIVPHPGEEDRPRIKIGPDGTGITWAADWLGNPSGFKWKPSIHMPRWASRITLEVTGVRVERLNDISPDAALAEGIAMSESDYEICKKDERVSIITFARLWQSINGPGSWSANPWVWVVEFKRVQP